MPTVRSVCQGLNLVLPMESSARLLSLMTLLGQEQTRQKISSALRGLHYVHFARFLPVFDASLLLVITEFDGPLSDLGDIDGLRAYTMDFAAVLSDEFTLILSHTRDKPRLPVRDFPEDFWRYVQTHHDARFQPFSAYDDKTVIDIVGKPLAPRMPPGLPPQQLGVDAADVQGNILRGYRATVAEHLALAVGDDPQGARTLLATLAQAAPTELHISTGAEWPQPEPDHCLTVGLTHEGLARLGVAPEVLAHFPRAFREGAARRARDNWDIDDAGPEHWRIGGTGRPAAHLLFSLLAKDEKAFATRLAGLLAACEAAGLRVVGRQATTTLSRPGRVHFGYQDSLSQPHIASGRPATATAEDGQPWAPPGDFLLGYVNNTGGDYLGDLPAKLGRNGTYAAFRLIKQDIEAFEKKIAEVAHNHPPLTFDQVAAKLMGRALDGRPLLQPAGGAPQGDDNRFDYGDPQARALGVTPDPQGAVCPFGAHVRRANPRSSLVMGRAFAHRLIRRGQPYVSRWTPEQTTPQPENGLAGLFICGNLEEQFEFVQRHYINGDLGSGNARNLHDPIAGRHRPGEARFVFSPGRGLPDVTIDNLPQWTTTVGSLYLFMPGLHALRLLARGAWSNSRKPAGYAGRFDASRFNPHDPAFLADPYPFYAEFRRAAPVSWIAAHDCYWVFSHALVTQVCAPSDDPVFLKPGNAQTRKGPPLDAERHLPEGLFFMNPPEHHRVRPLMDQALESAIGNARELAAARTRAALDKATPHGEGALEWVGSLASVVPREVFMQVMGWPDDPLGLFRGWVRQALDAHDHSADPATQLKGATSGMALRAYFQGLGRGCPVAHGAHGAQGAHGAVPAGGMYGKLQAQVAQGHLDPLALQESALHFALGGYLSTEFLLTTGVLNLLRHPEQLQWLRANPDRLPQAVREMLRYDAPFQLADRIVARDTELGGVKLRKGDRLAVVYGSANHDDTVFNDIDPDRFDIRRPSAQAGRAYGFGHGIHYCIGARLAEMVAEEALATLLNRHPVLRLGEFGPWRTDPYFRSVQRLLLLLR
jgi:cytochrome P450/deferrochelatase/peroxidase EfeB